MKTVDSIFRAIVASLLWLGDWITLIGLWIYLEVKLFVSGKELPPEESNAKHE